jgi:hypothetical protein
MYICSKILPAQVLPVQYTKYMRMYIIYHARAAYTAAFAADPAPPPPQGLAPSPGGVPHGHGCALACVMC